MKFEMMVMKCVILNLGPRTFQFALKSAGTVVPHPRVIDNQDTVLPTPYTLQYFVHHSLRMISTTVDRFCQFIVTVFDKGLNRIKFKG